MLHLYISHAPADKQYVAQFMEWVKPLQRQYNFRIWYDHQEPDPIVPYPWNVIFFWYSPRTAKRPYNRNMQAELEKAHIYLFFTSQKSLSTPWIDQIEVPRAVERYQQYGKQLIRIYPVLLTSSQWKIHSRLAAFPALGPVGKTLQQIAPNEDGWFVLMEELRKILPELRQNNIQEHQRLGLPADSFSNAPEPWYDTPERVIPFPNWAGWLIVAVTVYAAVVWMADLVKPSHKPYWPKKEPAKKEQPYMPTLPVPTAPMKTDTLTPSGARIRDAR